MCIVKVACMHFPVIDHEYVWSGARGGDETEYESSAAAYRFRVVRVRVCAALEAVSSEAIPSFCFEE